MLFKVLLAGMCSLCLVGTATLASAHEFIVKPDKTQAAKGESVGVQAQAAKRPSRWRPWWSNSFRATPRSP